MKHRQDEHGVTMKIKDETADQDLDNKQRSADQEHRNKGADNMMDAAARAVHRRRRGV